MTQIDRNILVELLSTNVMFDSKIDALVNLINATINKSLLQFEQNFNAKLAQQQLKLIEQFEKILSLQNKTIPESTKTSKSKKNNTSQDAFYFEPQSNQTEFIQVSDTPTIKSTSETKSKEIPVVKETQAIQSPTIISPLPEFKLIKPAILNELPLIVEHDLKKGSLFNGVFKSNSIEILKIPTVPKNINPLNQLASFMGQHFHIIEPIYKEIKGQINSPSLKVELNLSELLQHTKIIYLEWLKLMKTVDYLQYSVVDHKVVIHVEKLRKHPADAFVSGHWLELYATEKISNIIQDLSNTYRHPLKSKILMNFQFNIVNKLQAELDILFQIENQVYWVEVKTQYNGLTKIFSKYEYLAEVLGIDYQHMIFATSCISGKHNSTDKLTFIHINQFEDYLRKLIIQDFELQ